MPLDAQTASTAVAREGAAIALRGVALIRGGRRLLSDVDLRLEPGRRTVVMGPNGAGKSLLLRVVKGLEAPSAGGVTIGERRLDAASARDIGLVLQRPVLLRRSVAGNLDHALRAYGVPRRERSAGQAALLAEADLVDKADRPARRLSGGEQQRLSIARALAAQPEVLLLDEPTANLDPHATRRVEALIGDVAARGVKIVFVTHDAGQARRLADEVVFMHGGRIVEQSPAEAFFEAPRADAAQAYLAGRLCD